MHHTLQPANFFVLLSDAFFASFYFKFDHLNFEFSQIKPSANDQTRRRRIKSENWQFCSSCCLLIDCWQPNDSSWFGANVLAFLGGLHSIFNDVSKWGQGNHNHPSLSTKYDRNHWARWQSSEATVDQGERTDTLHYRFSFYLLPKFLLGILNSTLREKTKIARYDGQAWIVVLHFFINSYNNVYYSCTKCA